MIITLNKIGVTTLIILFWTKLASADMALTESQTDSLKCNKASCYVESAGSFLLTAKINSTVFENNGIFLEDITDQTTLSIQIGDYIITKFLGQANKYKLTKSSVTASWIESQNVCTSFACDKTKPFTFTTLTVNGRISGTSTISISGKNLSTETKNGSQIYGSKILAELCKSSKIGATFSKPATISVNGIDLTTILTGSCKQQSKAVKKLGVSYNLTSAKTTSKAPISINALAQTTLINFAGSYEGTYSGTDNGTVTATIANDGTISGTGNSAIDSSYQFAITGHVDASGNVSLIGSGSAGTATFTGNISQGMFSGTWSGEGVDQGAFQLSKLNSKPTIISGVVSISPVANSNVTVYSIVNGSKGIALGTGTTDAQGQYSIQAGFYTGPVLVEAINGSYTDPATGNTKQLKSILRSATVSANGSTIVNITPLSEATVFNASNASDGLVIANITNSILNATNLLGFDPITTQPIDPTQALPQSATKSSLIYAGQLGTVSQYLAENTAKTLPLAIADFADVFKLGNFNINPYITAAANNYGANDLNINGITSNFANGNNMMATCSHVLWCTGPTYLPLCSSKPVTKCVDPNNVVVNGICVVSNSTPITPATTLTKQWTGSWKITFPGRANPSCLFNDGGVMTMNITQNGNSFSGSVIAEGMEARRHSTCELVSVFSGNGTVSGTISGESVTFSMDPDGVTFTGSGTISGGIFTGSLIKSSGGSGTFNLH